MARTNPNTGEYARVVFDKEQPLSRLNMIMVRRYKDADQRSREQSKSINQYEATQTDLIVVGECLLDRLTDRKNTDPSKSIADNIKTAMYLAISDAEKWCGFTEDV